MPMPEKLIIFMMDGRTQTAPGDMFSSDVDVQPFIERWGLNSK